MVVYENLCYGKYWIIQVTEGGGIVSDHEEN